jgi:cell fate (sporulation/competence/biofilm development) regulator YmcA (YheA/YmcA/DUF963 family)
MIETAIITELRETINRAENMVPFMRSDMIQLLESAKSEIETLTDNLKQMQKERDEARREVCKSAGKWANYIAQVNNWDCFKSEETQ